MSDRRRGVGSKVAESFECEPLSMEDLQRDPRLRPLLCLRRSQREPLLSVPKSERHQAFLLRKAQKKAQDLASRNRRLSIDHWKGERRATQRLGVGKTGSLSYWELAPDDVDAALEAARISLGCNRSPQCETYRQVVGPSFATKWYAAVIQAELVGQSLPSGPGKLGAELASLCRALQESGDVFDKFRVRFLKRHGIDVLKSLGKCTRDTKLSPAPLAAEVRERFLAAATGSIPRSIVPGFHGTVASAYESIFKLGLLVPGQEIVPGQETIVSVRNGSVHGVGVYIATLQNPKLSIGFARGINQMLVCGVVDDAAEATSPASSMLGSFRVSKESSKVRHVGDAMVVFDSACVAPLFVASWSDNKETPPSAPTHRARRKPCMFRHRHAAAAVVEQWFWEKHVARRGSWLRSRLCISRKLLDKRVFDFSCKDQKLQWVRSLIRGRLIGGYW